MSINIPRVKVLSVFSLVMMNVIAVNSLRSLPIYAEYGFSLVFYCVLATLVFFIPTALVAAELATGWPQTGGIYVWVREAFGKNIGFLAIWLQWIYNIVWYPTILTFITGAICYFFNPEFANNKVYLLSTVMVLFWGITFLNSLGMKVASSIATIGTILGTLLPMIFIILLALFWLLNGNSSQISFTMSSLLPDLSRINNIAFFAAILFGFIGMEMSAVHAEEVKNPQRDYPRALLYSTIIIFLSLVLSSLAVAIIVPQSKLSFVSGFLDAFSAFFIAYNMSWMIPVIATLIIIGAFSGVCAWTIGPAKGLLAAAQDVNTLKIFQKTNKKGAPVPILFAQAIVFTVLCTIFLLMPTINSSYWILSVLSAQCALGVYILIFAAVIRLRYSHPDVKRSFVIGGGKIGVWLVGVMGIIACLLTILLGFLPPSQIETGNIVKYELILVGGIILLNIPPFLLAKKELKSLNGD